MKRVKSEQHVAIRPRLGLGIYTMADAARYTGVHPATLRSWFCGRRDGIGKGPVFRSDYRRVGSQFSLSFLDMIDALVAVQFRGCGVKMCVVRSAFLVLQKRLATQHPFCHNNLYTDGEAIILYSANEVGDEILDEVVSCQQLFLHIKEQLEHVDYSRTTNLAERWRIAEGVTIDPTICRGRPVARSTGVTTFVLAQAYRANRQDEDVVSDLFNLSSETVLRAVEFEEAISKRRVA